MEFDWNSKDGEVCRLRASEGAGARNREVTWVGSVITCVPGDRQPAQRKGGGNVCRASI